MSIADYDHVVSLWNKTEGIGLSAADSYESIQFFLNRNIGLSYVFEFNSTIVGAVLCGHDGRRGYIHHLAVDSEYRGNKIGSELTSTCLLKLKEVGIGKCHLFVFDDNEVGRNFWSNTGWELREDLLIYSKKLD